MTKNTYLTRNSFQKLAFVSTGLETQMDDLNLYRMYFKHIRVCTINPEQQLNLILKTLNVKLHQASPGESLDTSELSLEGHLILPPSLRKVFCVKVEFKRKVTRGLVIGWIYPVQADSDEIHRSHNNLVFLTSLR